MRESPLYEYGVAEEGSGVQTVTRNVWEVCNTSTGLRLRSGYGTSYKSMGVYKNGTQVIELDRQTVGGILWIHCTLVKGGETGYMSTKYLRQVESRTETIRDGRPENLRVIQLTQCRMQLFRVYATETDSDAGVVTAKARHVFYDLCGKAFGFDPARTTKNVNTDCSALVRVCVNFAGIAVGDFTTSNEASVLVAAGGFERITDDKHCKREDYLLRGGILVTRTKGHTVVVLSNGALATEEVPVETGNLLVASGTWNLRTGPGTQYGAVKTVHGGDRLAQVDPDGWIPVNIGGDVLWISPKAIMEG